MLQVPARDIQIVNRLGIHMRPAMQLVETANRFRSRVTVRKGKAAVDGKSIYELLGLYSPRGTTLQIEADGDDADACLDALEALAKSKFGED
jgi:phosphotransferase system HPr (HPr) family protein